MDLIEIREGLARLLIPDVPRGRGPGKNVGLPFFNHTMEKNRDMTVLLLRAMVREGLTVFDGLAATGAMGVRVALEVPGITVACNDRSAVAVELIRRNSDLNGVRLAAVFNENLQAHLSRNRYDCVDIDPFGTPVPYLDSALQSARPNGILAVTATDTAVLCGAQPRACARRYDAKSLHIDCCKEIGLRILIGHCARVAARYDKGIRPLVTFGTDHYFRIFLQIAGGVSNADESLGSVGYVCFDPVSGNRWLSLERPPGKAWAGPLWSGRLIDKGTISRMAPLRYNGHNTATLLAALEEEAEAPPLYVTAHFLARTLKTSPPRMEHIMESLESSGYNAARTHFDPIGVKTDAPWDEVTRLFLG